MYAWIWKKYREKFTDFPLARRPRVGAAIQELRIAKGLRQHRFAAAAGINLSTLKSLENDHLQATSLSNLERCAKILDVSLERLILEAREHDPANFFVLKKDPPPAIGGLKKKKRSPHPWNKITRLETRAFDAVPLTAPLACKKDFFACRIRLAPRQSLPHLRLGAPGQVAGFISEGHNLRLLCGRQTVSLTSNQGFLLDGSRPHSLWNDDADIAASVYLVTRLAGSRPRMKVLKAAAPEKGALRISRALETLRALKSPRRARPLPYSVLADMTDSLDDNKVRGLAKLPPHAVIYWDKIEDLLGATSTSMEEFLLWSRGESPAPIRVGTARDRAMIDYGNYAGIKIYSVLGPSADNAFHCGELHLEGRRALKRQPWVRKDNCMLLFYVEEGEIRLQAGRNRLAMLTKGESVYFDASLGYLLNNPGELPAKCFFAAYPAIRY